MAYVVRRPHRRFEIRESSSTPRGPRSRTLATFRTLDDEVIERAQARATRPLDAQRIRDRARALGAVVSVATPADDAARALLYRLHRGEHVGRAHRLLLADALARGGPTPTDPGPSLRAAMQPASARGVATEDRDLIETVRPLLDWIDRTDQQRGTALVDLLDLADAIPRRRERTPLEFPSWHRG